MVPIVKKMEEWTKKSEKQNNKAQKKKQEVARGGSMTFVFYLICFRKLSFENFSLSCVKLKNPKENK